MHRVPHALLLCSVPGEKWKVALSGNLTSQVCSCSLNKEGAATVAVAAMSFPFPVKVNSDRASGSRAAQMLLIKVACLSLNHMMVVAVRLSVSLSSEEPALPQRTPQNCRLRICPPAACSQDPPRASSTRLPQTAPPATGHVMESRIRTKPADPYQVLPAAARPAALPFP